ncbi:MAG: carbohydrate ABC transporter permease, partial [Acidothermaceae bacterium]
VAALVLTLVISIPAGYAMALTKFRGRRTLLVVTLVVMLIPNTALVLPLFLEMNAVGLVNTALAVVLPFSFYPFGVYLAYIYFSSSIPSSLLEAARIDGAGELQVFVRIALPLAMPIIALVGFFNFVQNWNNYFLPFVMLPSSGKYPVQVGLSTLLSSTTAFNPSAAGSGSIELPTLALATVVSVLPVLIIFLFSQRFLVAGLTAGGTKG